MSAKVIIDRGRHTAIMYKQGSVWIHVVAMQAGELTTSRISEEELTRDWSELVGYPPSKAAAKYLLHPAGVSPAARRALEHVIDTAFFGE